MSPARLSAALHAIHLAMQEKLHSPSPHSVRELAVQYGGSTSSERDIDAVLARLDAVAVLALVT